MDEKERAKKAFGKVLYQERLSKNISQATLAEKAGMDETYVSDLERALYMPSLFTVIKLAKALDIKPSSLISRVEELLS